MVVHDEKPEEDSRRLIIRETSKTNCSRGYMTVGLILTVSQGSEGKETIRGVNVLDVNGLSYSTEANDIVFWYILFTVTEDGIKLIKEVPDVSDGAFIELRYGLNKIQENILTTLGET